MPIQADTLFRFIIIICAILFVIPIKSAESASPSLFYSILPLNVSKKDCLNRAYTAVAAAVTGQILQRADDVALVNDDYNLAVHCRRTADQTSLVTIIVSHRSSFLDAKELALNIQHGIETSLVK